MTKNNSYYKGKSSLTERFIHAFRGIGYAWQKEPNFKIEAVIAIGVLGAMMVLPLSGVERAILVLVIALVLSFEIINSLFERLLDLVHPHFSPEVKRIKDTMAGVVLLGSFASVVIAGFILIRPLLAFDLTLAQFLVIFRSPLWIRAAKTVTILGDWQIIAVLGAVLACVLLYRKRYKLFSLLIGGVGIGELLLASMKLFFGRERPPGSELIETNGFSFPSGHVFIGTIFWLILAYILTDSNTERKYVWGLSGLVILFIALSRIILSVHWFSDVVGGLLLGIFWFFLWFGINEKLFREK